MASLQKNVASQHVKFGMVSATTGAADTGATVSVFVAKDGGAQASGGGTVTNLTNGQYDYAPTQAETNATDVGFLFTATGDIPVSFDFHTDIVDANGFISVNVADINAVSTSSVTTINANIGTTQPINFIGTGTNSAVSISSNRKKGLSATFEFTMTNSSTGGDQTGLTVTSKISKDGGAFASTTNSVTETALGWYQLVLTATEMTANNIALQMTAASATARDIAIQTQP